MEYQRFGDALPDVLKLLDTAMDIIANSTQMPQADPDDIAWDEFWFRPYSQTAARLFTQLFDLAKAAEKALDRFR